MLREPEADDEGDEADEEADEGDEEAEGQEPATGNGEQKVGNREQGTGNKERGTGEKGPETEFPLPETFEEFLDLVARALPPPPHLRDRDLERDQMLLEQLADQLWSRLQIYEWQVQGESMKLEEALEKAAQPAASAQQLRRHTSALKAAFEIDPLVTQALDVSRRELKKDMKRLAQWRYGPAVYREVTPPPPRTPHRVASDQ